LRVLMIINYKNLTYFIVIYDNNIEEDLSYKDLGIDFCNKLKWNFSVERRILEIGNLIVALSTIVKKLSFGYGKKRSFSLIHYLSL